MDEDLRLLRLDCAVGQVLNCAVEAFDGVGNLLEVEFAERILAEMIGYQIILLLLG
jgi:hypothetical protein